MPEHSISSAVCLARCCAPSVGVPLAESDDGCLHQPSMICFMIRSASIFFRSPRAARPCFGLLSRWTHHYAVMMLCPLFGGGKQPIPYDFRIWHSLPALIVAPPSARCRPQRCRRLHCQPHHRQQRRAVPIITTPSHVRSCSYQRLLLPRWLISIPSETCFPRNTNRSVH